MRKQSTGAGKGQLIGLVSFLLVIVLGGVGFGFFMLGEYERQDAAARQQLADLRADSLALVVASQDFL